MPQWHADLFEVGFDEVAEDARVDLVLAEHGFVLSEVDRVQPLGDVHRRSRTRFDSDDGPRETASPGRSVGRPLWGRETFAQITLDRLYRGFGFLVAGAVHLTFCPRRVVGNPLVLAGILDRT